MTRVILLQSQEIDKSEDIRSVLVLKIDAVMHGN